MEDQKLEKRERKKLESASTQPTTQPATQAKDTWSSTTWSRPGPPPPPPPPPPLPPSTTQAKELNPGPPPRPPLPSNTLPAEDRDPKTGPPVKRKEKKRKRKTEEFDDLQEISSSMTATQATERNPKTGPPPRPPPPSNAIPAEDRNTLTGPPPRPPLPSNAIGLPAEDRTPDTRPPPRPPLPSNAIPSEERNTETSPPPRPPLPSNATPAEDRNPGPPPRPPLPSNAMPAENRNPETLPPVKKKKKKKAAPPPRPPPPSTAVPSEDRKPNSPPPPRPPPPSKPLPAEDRNPETGLCTHLTSGIGSRYYRWIAVGLGVLCSLLALLSIGLAGWLLTERDQLKTEQINLLKEKEQLLDRPKCPTGWGVFECNCYYNDQVSRTFSHGRLFCQSLGADLVIVKSQEKQSYLTTMYYAGWIGVKKKDGIWRWIDDTPLSTGYWHPTQPDASECVVIHSSSNTSDIRTWHDYACENSWQYSICERPAYKQT
ncbi:basic proline-rich protein-like [Engraulis encrasicolus]|uniref:basic proline-rich protein-like n=1 Tax=Engraulis encrasicolus TaxID=184585 RepID=UPI002FCF9616